MMNNEPEYSNWQEAWEAQARSELEALRMRPAAELLALVQTERFGGSNVLWAVITERVTLAEAGWTGFAVLESDADHHDRYHCAAALLRLLQSNAWEPVQLTTGPEQAANLVRLRDEIERRMGQV